MHPIAFYIGTLTIYWYGILVALGFLVGLWTASRRGTRDGLGTEAVMDAGPWILAGTLVGARMLYVTSYWHEEFAGKPILNLLKFRSGGLVFYGGLGGAALALIVYVRRKKLPLWRMADAFAPSIALGYAIGRVGCLMTGCCFGTTCSLPWAIHFPLGHTTYPHGVHPTQLYESALSLALYAGLAWLHKRKRFDGQVFAVYLFGYAILRSCVEFFRGDYPARFFGGWVTPGQVASVLIVTTGAVLYRVLPRAER